MFSIVDVPFLQTGLGNFLSAHAVNIHVTKHHQAYVDTANKLVPESEFAGQTLEQIIKTSTGAIFNNCSQHFNHSFFWMCFSYNISNPSDKVLDFFSKAFGSLDKFKDTFVNKASTIFGSGWCYLVLKPDQTVEIIQYSNANNPIKDGYFPILCIDTLEHAWYIDYENRKAEYFMRFWNYVNWDFVESRLQLAKII